MEPAIPTTTPAADNKRIRLERFFEKRGLKIEKNSLYKGTYVDSLASLSYNLQGSFGRKLRHFRLQKEAVDHWIEFLIDKLLASLAILLIGTFLLLLALTHYFFQWVPLDRIGIGFEIIGAITGLILTVVMMALLNLIDESDRVRRLMKSSSDLAGFTDRHLINSMVITTGLVSAGLSIPLYYWLRAWGDINWILIPLVLFYTFLLSAFGFLYLVGMAGIASLVEAYLRRLACFRLPTVYIVSILAELIRDVEVNRGQWDTPGSKNKWAAKLEEIAVICERVMSKRLRAADPETNLQIRTYMSEVALAFRMKKKLLFNSRPGSRKQFVDSLSRNLFNLVEGNLGNLETESLTKLTLREGSWIWVKRIRDGVKAMIISAIPIALIYFSRSIPDLDFPEPYFSYAKIFGIAWFAVSLIIMLDPLYNTKLAALKDLRSFNIFGGKTDKE